MVFLLTSTKTNVRDVVHPDPFVHRARFYTLRSRATSRTLSSGSIAGHPPFKTDHINENATIRRFRPHLTFKPVARLIFERY